MKIHTNMNFLHSHKIFKNISTNKPKKKKQSLFYLNQTILKFPSKQNGWNVSNKEKNLEIKTNN